MEQFITAPQLAEVLGLHPETVYHFARSGVIPSFKIGKALRFRVSEVEACLIEKRDL